MTENLIFKKNINLYTTVHSSGFILFDLAWHQKEVLALNVTSP